MLIDVYHNHKVEIENGLFLLPCQLMIVAQVVFSDAMVANVLVGIAFDSVVIDCAVAVVAFCAKLRNIIHCCW